MSKRKKYPLTGKKYCFDATEANHKLIQRRRKAGRLKTGHAINALLGQVLRDERAG